jgi:hypothetical protein
MHRPLPADSELVQAIAVLARAQQDAVWNRGQLLNQLRWHLKQYFPAARPATARRSRTTGEPGHTPTSLPTRSLCEGLRYPDQVQYEDGCD